MKNDPGLDLRIEPLGPSHNRAAFRSGVPDLDGYLHAQAGQDARRNVAAPFVLVDGTGTILGYYTLSAYGIQLSELPQAVAKKLPRYPVVPATLLGRLAVGESVRGQKLGRFLLLDALYRSWRNSSLVASAAVVVDALDERARDFYLHHEFQPLGDHADKLFLPMSTIEKLFKIR